MACINFENVCVEFSMYNIKGRSIKQKILNVATGGALTNRDNGEVKVKALNNLNFSFNDGDRVGIVGHNGAGKSTLLRTINKIYTPTAGRAEVIGATGSLIDISLGIDPDATGRENLYIRAALMGISKQFLNEKIEEIIEFSGLGPYIDMPVRTYSSGMHLRLAFSVSTIVSPEILIMDEWLSVGDESFQEKAEKRLKKLIDRKNLLRDLCTKIIWLEHGEVVDIGDPEAIISRCFK